MCYLATYRNLKEPSRGVHRKAVLKICSKFTEKHICNFIEIALRHDCSAVNLLHICRTPFYSTPLEGCFRVTQYCNRRIKLYKELDIPNKSPTFITSTY